VSESVLLNFLDNGLINVSSDDVKLQKLSSTADDLAAVLKNAPERAASFALIAFDPEAPVDDPVVVETMEALKKHWTTYANTFHGVPLAVVRGMLLSTIALEGVAFWELGTSGGKGVVRCHGLASVRKILESA
jgi:GTPase-associated system helical domain